LDADQKTRNKKVIEAIRVTRNVKNLEQYAYVFSDLLVAVLNGGDLKTEVQKSATRIGLGDLKTMIERSSSDPMVACYIDSSFPAMLFMVYKYADSVEEAILANANAGGENVARGSLLGALIGAAHGIQSFPEWTHGLY